MKLISWNLNKSNSPSVHELLQQQKADLYLLQEVTGECFRSLKGTFGQAKVIWFSKPQNIKQEGSALFAPNLELNPLDAGLLQGWATLASGESSWGSFCVVSLHAPTRSETLAQFPISGKSCSNWIEECALPKLSQLAQAYANAIIGGDTNCARTTGVQLGKRYARAHLAFTEQYGYTEALWKQHGRELPTYRSHNKNLKAKGWYVCNDHFFLRGPVASKIDSCVVKYEPNPPGDHAPVELRLDK